VDAFWLTGRGPVSLREPLYLGIVNVTPDSFSDGGRFLEPRAALAQAAALVLQGARALDLGAESTRPGSAGIPPGPEWARLEPVLALLRAEQPQVPVSLDTRHAPVAVRGLLAGAAAINDVTGFRDPQLLAVAAASDCGVIAMRSRVEDGVLAMPPYSRPGPGSSISELLQELRGVRDRLLRAGVARERILLDPGFGFGTTFAGDRALWEALPGLPEALDWPVERFCIGISRKRFLAWKANQPTLPADQRDDLTAEAHREAMGLGYRVFRTHRVPSWRPPVPAG